ncbi:hypothetical protein LPA44_05140 [Halobacterium sp. KA-4]|jgi:hypothetical protein|uniref:hypothetical protein n=1 Tax=Halobacterium sp. KA-4 TaxID=2896367 RepID=UPI001E55B344|nr:hypothetical protein [Halobacterium sp. KA-4]MCD2199284.1 hypothetical protein [Halobacterium sp. KA-4]
MAGVLDLVYVALALLVAVGGVFTVWWIGRDLDDGIDPTSDLLRAVAVSVFLVLLAWPLVS